MCLAEIFSTVLQQWHYCPMHPNGTMAAVRDFPHRCAASGMGSDRGRGAQWTLPMRKRRTQCAAESLCPREKGALSVRQKDFLSYTECSFFS